MPSRSVDWLATLLAKGAAPLQPEHLQLRRQPSGSNTLHCVLLDLSASMLRGQKLQWAKGCLLELTQQFYRRREHMAVIGFHGEQARLIQSPGRVATFNESWITPLEGGGGTPIASAMQMLEQLLAQRQKSEDRLLAHVWMLSDGRVTPLPAKPQHAAACHIVDFENDAIALQRCKQLADAWQGDWLRAEDLFASADKHEFLT